MSELYRDFIDRKADDVISALNGSITPDPGNELYRDFLNRKFNDVILGIDNYLPSLSFPSVSGAICTFNSQYAGLPLKAHEVDIDYTGSAISGVNIQRPYGINQWDEQWELGIYNLTTGNPEGSSYSIRGRNRILVKPNTSYYANNAYFRILYYDADDNYISYKVGIGVFTTPSNCHFVRFYLGDAYGTTYNNDISINYPSTETSYHAYEGQSFNITFDTPIYGGSYNCLTGIVTSDKDSGGGDISPTYQQTATANCLTLLGENNVWADTGNTTLQYIKLGN